jgi:hypothetical protein
MPYRRAVQAAFAGGWPDGRGAGQRGTWMTGDGWRWVTPGVVASADGSARTELQPRVPPEPVPANDTAFADCAYGLLPIVPIISGWLYQCQPQHNTHQLQAC